jgi:hypothetical protein
MTTDPTEGPNKKFMLVVQKYKVLYGQNFTALLLRLGGPGFKSQLADTLY